MKFSLALTTMMVASATAFTTPGLMSSSPTTVLSLSEVAATAEPVATYESKRDTEDKLRQAEKIGAANKQFGKYVTLLTAYKAEKGDCNVPEDYEESNLGQWLYNQRKLRKHGKMDPDKVATLEELGVVWSLRSLMVKKE